MDLSDKCEAWFAALDDDQRSAVRSTLGLIPDWMVASLADSEFPVIPVKLADGVTAFMMPTALMLHLGRLA